MLTNIDQHSFSDIDECDLKKDGCAHKCENTEGSFKCSCKSGFKLLDDKKTCKGKLIFFVIADTLKH